ncbi:Ubiquitin carboxyl-terminal hydrolase 21 [Echinococcus granulosus]|nr:Ubiquitin carboxyl-terminal hydrolase 21 [Echinococcus granulosus]
MGECNASCDSDNHSSLPPRSTKKRGFGNSLKKLLASALRCQVEWYTTPDLYRTSRDMFPEKEDVDRGGENAPQKALKNTPCNGAAESPEISSHKRPAQSDLSPKLSTPSGLENLGNTCYLNAILQCLRSTELVRDYCDNTDNVLCKQLGSNCDLFRTFAGLIRKMESVTNGSIGSNTILKFKNAFTRFVPCYGGNLQQDALEFFTYLLDGLHEEIKERPQTPVLDESTLPRPVSTAVSPSPSIVPTKCMRRCKLRMGGLKHSESSGKLTAASEGDVEIGFDSGDLDWAKPSIRKWLRARRPKVRAVSIRRNESILLDDICQPGLGSAETTATEKSFLKVMLAHLCLPSLYSHLWVISNSGRCLQCVTSLQKELFWNLALCVPECYLNAILQCLRSTELVRDYCDNTDNVLCKQLGSNCDLFRTFAGLIRKMESVTNGSIGSNTILKFKNAFTRFVPCYGGNLQQDALEFFTYLLDGLHEEIKERPQTPVLDESTLPRPVSTAVSPSPSIVPTKCMRRCKLRMGGLKHSESSGKLTAASEGDVEIGFDSGDLDWAKPSIRKWLRARRPKVRAVSIRRNESILLDDICQPGLGSAETTATEKSFLKDTFVGHLQTQVRCLQCNNVTTRDELFWNLALCVPEVSSDKESKDKAQHRISSSSSAVDMSVSLDDCLCAFTKAEVLDDLDKLFCTKCKTLTRTQLQVMISRLPKILVLQFQRFESTCCKTKKQHLINFHFEQDMAPYYVNGSTEKHVAAVPERASTLPKCTNSSASQQPVDSAAVNDVTSNSSTTPSTSKADVTSASGSTNYRLYAVVYHQGGTEHGHYTARCHLPSPDPSTIPHSWFLFDDENVSHVPNSKDVIQSTAYILFYERIDEKVDGAAPSKPMQDAVSLASETAPVKVTINDDEDAI